MLTFAGILPERIYVHRELAGHSGVREGVLDLLELELQARVSCHVGAVDRTLVCRKSSRAAQALNCWAL